MANDLHVVQLSYPEGSVYMRYLICGFHVGRVEPFMRQSPSGQYFFSCNIGASIDVYGGSNKVAFIQRWLQYT